MSEHIEEFRNAMLMAGLEPPAHIDPGKFMRFPGVGKSNGNTAGWCLLFADQIGGTYGDWASTEERRRAARVQPSRRRRQSTGRG